MTKRHRSNSRASSPGSPYPVFFSINSNRTNHSLSSLKSYLNPIEPDSLSSWPSIEPLTSRKYPNRFKPKITSLKKISNGNFGSQIKKLFIDMPTNIAYLDNKIIIILNHKKFKDYITHYFPDIKYLSVLKQFTNYGYRRTSY